MRGEIISSLTNSGGGHDRGTAKRSTYLLAGASVIGLLAAAPEARAQDMQQIQAQINEMQATIQALQKQVQDAKAQAAAANAAAANAGGGDLDLKVKWKGAPELSSGDGKYNFKVRGRVMVDYNGIDQDEPITLEGDINAVELRRARLGVEGVVYYDWKYKFEIEFAGDEVEIKDAYLAYANWWDAIDTSEIRIGNQYVYTSLEQITSSRFITFLERAAFTDAFLPSVEADRQIGAAIVVGDEHWSFQTGAYGASVGPASGDNEDIPGQEDFDDDKLALSVRGTVAPINREVNGVHQVVHLGASFRHRDAGTLNDCTPRGSVVDGVDDGRQRFVLHEQSDDGWCERSVPVPSSGCRSPPCRCLCRYAAVCRRRQHVAPRGGFCVGALLDAG